MSMRLPAFGWGAVLAAALGAFPLASSAADSAPVGNAKRGAGIAPACQACHGPHGEGMPAAGYPRLAGQTASYLDKQLRDYVSGLRNNPVMAPLAKAYNEQQRADLAAYFASLSPPYAATTAKPDPALLARGRLLVRAGDEAKQLQACANCHGPDGSGEPLSAPYLMGQSANYLTSTINEWKSGARSNDGGKLMTVVANRLDDQDAQAVGTYLENLGHVP
jgi:cytochrome c553